ncbi:hypothetical protein bsdcttw_24450 [Anaerocolumna chitinilytica]|uniref:Uncharacterized protein n=1 Tax=Anaerocolumna chitinilytica TaxID=1727145 RepID=A0A7I8DQ12_9FIRM|nr:hypothetical protein bsdcttw_24450 [Anaerocolumna chitinilytica]
MVYIAPKGIRKNSQAKGPISDDTLESASTDEATSTILEGIFQVKKRRRTKFI